MMMSGLRGTKVPHPSCRDSLEHVELGEADHGRDRHKEKM